MNIKVGKGRLEFCPNAPTGALPRVGGVADAVLGDEITTYRQVFTNSNQTFSGSNTYSGNNTYSGTSTYSGAVVGSNTTQSTSTTTGAIKTAGGLGVAKNANIGGSPQYNGPQSKNQGTSIY